MEYGLAQPNGLARYRSLQDRRVQQSLPKQAAGLARELHRLQQLNLTAAAYVAQLEQHLQQDADLLEYTWAAVHERAGTRVRLNYRLRYLPVTFSFSFVLPPGPLHR